MVAWMHLVHRYISEGMNVKWNPWHWAEVEAEIVWVVVSWIKKRGGVFIPIQLIQYELLRPIITNGLCKSSIQDVIWNFHPISAYHPVGSECIDTRQHQIKVRYLYLNWIVLPYQNHLAQQTIIHWDVTQFASKLSQFKRSKYVPPLR